MVRIWQKLCCPIVCLFSNQIALCWLRCLSEA
ncbi:hypothetical protein V6Z11_D10G224000 [Gossypium hirsutum]